MSDKPKVDPEKTYVLDEDVEDELEDVSLTRVIRDLDEATKRRSEDSDERAQTDEDENKEADDDDDDRLGYVVPED